MPVPCLLCALLVMVLVLCVDGCGFAGPLSPELHAATQRVFAGHVPELAAAYKAWDAKTRGGLGNSEATTSGGLGWGEASFLRDYVYMYRATRDTYWLDKLVTHWGKMAASLRTDDRGYRAWDDAGYSVSVIRAQVKAGAVTVEPSEQRPSASRDLPKATGHDYEIRFPAADRFQIWDCNDAKELEAGAYAGKLTVTSIPAAKLTVSGPAAPGDLVAVETIAPERCQYQVHDGMVTYRLAQFVEIVTRDPKLQATYGATAAEILQFMDRDLLQKWEYSWRDLADGAGVYCFTPNVTQRFPGYSLPHNQYLALARAWLVLADLPGFANADLCRRRATAMATYFRRNLKPIGNAYEWNYWDPLPGEEIRPHLEDYSHATIDVGFAVEAAARGVVFDSTDLQRFASTYVDVMWNGDRAQPKFGRNIKTKGSDAEVWSDWLELSEADPRVWELGLAMYQAKKATPPMTPTMLMLYDKLVGISESERAPAQ